jgi:hypothetical protein
MPEMFGSLGANLMVSRKSLKIDGVSLTKGSSLYELKFTDVSLWRRNIGVVDSLVCWSPRDEWQSKFNRQLTQRH